MNKIDNINLIQIDINTEKVWEIAKISSDYRNILMEIFGEETYY